MKLNSYEFISYTICKIFQHFDTPFMLTNLNGCFTVLYVCQFRYYSHSSKLKCHFFIRFYEPEDQKYGHTLPNGSWTGMIGELLKNVSYNIKTVTIFLNFV